MALNAFQDLKLKIAKTGFVAAKRQIFRSLKRNTNVTKSISNYRK